MLPFLACQQSLTDALGGGQDLLHHAIRSILVSPDLSWAGSLAQAARQLFVAAAATTKSIDPFASNPQLRCPCTAFLGLTSICAHPFFVAFEGLHFLVQNFSPLNRSGVADVAEWLRQSQPLPELTVPIVAGVQPHSLLQSPFEHMDPALLAIAHMRTNLPQMVFLHPSPRPQIVSVHSEIRTFSTPPPF
jgi:hypothetical protein